MAINLRIATEEDIAGILTLYHDSLDKAGVLDIESAKIIFRKQMQYPDYKLFIAQTEQEIVGTFAILIMENIGHLGNPSAIVEDVAVSSKFQNKGIGKQMMAYAMEYAKSKGCYKLVLSSNLKRQNAHQFYESLGFEKHGYSFRVNLND